MIKIEGTWVLPFINVCFSQTIKAMTKQTHSRQPVCILLFKLPQHNTTTLTHSRSSHFNHVLQAHYFHCCLHGCLCFPLLAATSIPTPSVPATTNTISNSCNAGTYSVLYALIYVVLTFLPSFLESAPSLSCHGWPHWWVFSIFCLTYLIYCLV